MASSRQTTVARLQESLKFKYHVEVREEVIASLTAKLTQPRVDAQESVRLITTAMAAKLRRNHGADGWYSTNPTFTKGHAEQIAQLDLKISELVAQLNERYSEQRRQERAAEERRLEEQHRLEEQ
ncbi:hypothetical protein, partial [Legionella oakridgensis]